MHAPLALPLSVLLQYFFALSALKDFNRKVRQGIAKPAKKIPPHICHSEKRSDEESAFQ
jgi:hypothetical protein